MVLPTNQDIFSLHGFGFPSNTRELLRGGGGGRRGGTFLFHLSVKAKVLENTIQVTSIVKLQHVDHISGDGFLLRAEFQEFLDRQEFAGVVDFSCLDGLQSKASSTATGNRGFLDLIGNGEAALRSNMPRKDPLDCKDLFGDTVHGDDLVPSCLLQVVLLVVLWEPYYLLVGAPTPVLVPLHWGRYY